MPVPEDSKKPREKTIDELFEEGTAIDEALRKAVREELIRHKKLGNAIVVWEDSQVKWIPAEEIDVDAPESEGPVPDPEGSP